MPRMVCFDLGQGLKGIGIPHGPARVEHTNTIGIWEVGERTAADGV